MHALPTRQTLLRALLAALLLVALLLAALRAWQLVIRAQALEHNLQRLEAAAALGLEPTRWPELCAEVETVRRSTEALRLEAAPLLPLAPMLGWLPSVGPELTATPSLLLAAGELGAVASQGCAEALTLAAPLPAGQPAPALLIARLRAAAPRMAALRDGLDRASAALASVPAERLAPSRATRLAQLAARLPDVRAALDLALAAPALLGADGERSYLVVVQNPDELRPTGGFISAAGLLTMRDGEVVAFNTRDSALLDDLAAAPYPLAPEPMRRYMMSKPMAPALWVFRDANWSPDFPTSAAQMLALYELGQGQGADGVLAITPEAVRGALAALGPVAVTGTSQPVSADNVVEMIRTAYSDALAQGRSEDRKSFVNRLAAALLARVQERGPSELLALARALERALDERAALLYLPNSPASTLLTSRGWDGAIRPGAQDFLMVVDANVGYNKVGPNVRQQIRYVVDLSAPAAPWAVTTIEYTNLSPAAAGCLPSNQRAGPAASYVELTTDCYWSYTRLLVPNGASLARFAVPRVPDSWMLGGDGDRGRVYSERGEGGTRVYGALVVVPRAASQRLSFRYELPPSVLVREGQLLRYQLRIQRQPGQQQRAVVQVRLPDGAAPLRATPAPQSRTGQTLSFELPLATDQSVEIVFSQP